MPFSQGKKLNAASFFFICLRNGDKNVILINNKRGKENKIFTNCLSLELLLRYICIFQSERNSIKAGEMMQHLILASGSPRRKELLKNLRLTFDVVVSQIDESFNEDMRPEEVVMHLAYQKASDVAKLYPYSFVIGADTIVCCENQILGKPKDQQEAFDMLKMLSGKTHEVFTGVSIVHGQKHSTFYEKTEVTFWELSDEEIHDYISSGEPLDKAGSYGIQELGSALVKKIHGDYFSVVGLPVSRTIRELRKLGFSKR
jgi:septum formation protein